MNANLNYPLLQESLIERVSLLEKLEASIHHKLTLIIAPPGYGKTTLVAQFAQKTIVPVAWHTLEKQDQDLPNLFEHSLNALSQVASEIGTLSPVAGTTASELAVTVTSYLRDNVSTDFLYVMDDVHHLLDSLGAKIWIKAFIETLPPTCHLILIGQAFPPLSIIELIARREMISIGQKDLSFSLEEVDSLAKKLESKLPDEQVKKVFSRILGWPAGTLLALQPLPDAIEDLLFDGQKAPEALFDALADRLFRFQSPALQAFLLSSSTLSRMTPTLCQAAIHLANSLEHLTEALQRNLFIAKITGGLAYHSLFRDFLQRKLQAQKPAQFIQHHIDAGHWFEAENRLDEAFEHYVVAGQWKQAADIAERAAPIYLSHGKTETLLHWREQLNAVSIQVPRLLHMCAVIRRDRYEYALAKLDLAEAADGFHAQDNNKGLIQIDLLEATIDNQCGHFQEAINQAEPFSRDMSISPNLRGFAQFIVGTAALHLGKLDDALTFLKTVLPLYRDTGDMYAVAQLLMTLEVAYFRSGQFPDAAQCVQEVMAIRRSLGETVGIVMALNNLGYHYHLLGEYQQAQQTLDEGLEVANRVPDNRAESHVLWTMGDLQRDRGQFGEASRLYQRSLQLTGNSEPFLQASVLVSWSTLMRWEGNLEDAQKLALDAHSIAENHHLTWECLLARLALDAIHLMRGEFKSVKQGLETVITQWIQHPSPQLTHALGLRTYAALLSSEDAVAHQYLKLAITNANHPANLQPLIAEIIRTPLLRTFVERHISRYEILQRGIQALEKAQVDRTNIEEPNEISTYSLRVSVLGREIIERDTRKIPLSDWQAISARELFFYLLFKGASTREEIGLVLWPDSSIQQIRGKFHATLHRVRDAVGTNVIVFENELYLINPEVDLWCDVYEFKSLVKQAAQSAYLLSHTELLWRRAIDLYRGDFLPAFDVAWVVAYRMSLTQMYLDALVALAKCLRLRGDIQESITLLKCALDVDSFREDIHRLLLNDYKILGDRSLIVHHIQELKQLFQNELGTSPSPETIALSQSLLR